MPPVEQVCTGVRRRRFGWLAAGPLDLPWRRWRPKSAASRPPTVSCARYGPMKATTNQIQALLKLEAIGQTRGVLKTASNKLSIVAGQVQSAVADANDALRRHLDVTTLAREDVLAAINLRRRTLGLVEIGDLGAGTDLSAGILGKGWRRRLRQEDCPSGRGSVGKVRGRLARPESEGSGDCGARPHHVGR